MQEVKESPTLSRHARTKIEEQCSSNSGIGRINRPLYPEIKAYIVCTTPIPKKVGMQCKTYIKPECNYLQKN